jgi:hypothetical protein
MDEKVDPSIRGSFKNIPEITLFLRKTKQYDHLSYISFQTFPLCKYKLQPAAVKVLKTIVASIL